MTPLLEITTVPIEISVKSTSPKLEYTPGTVEMEITRDESGRVDVRSKPIHLRLDTFEHRGGGGRHPMKQQLPSSQTYEATAAYADEGQIILRARFGQQDASAAQASMESASAAPPQAGGGVKPVSMPMQGGGSAVDLGSMEIRYQMDKVRRDWKIEKGEFKFTPGDIEITVEQMPSITIKYNGSPIFVPRSADPNYEPVNVRA